MAHVYGSISSLSCAGLIRRGTASTSICCLASPTISHHIRTMLDSSLFWECVSVMGSTVPVGIAVLGCKCLRVGMEKDIAVAFSRSSVQMFFVSFALKFTFEGEKLLGSLIVIIFMVLFLQGDREKDLPQSRLIATLSLALGSLGILALMILLTVSPVTPCYIVPTTGYVIGNSMSMVGATMHGLQKDILLHNRQIETALTLGATPEQAVRSYVQRAMLQGMSPWVDSIKTAGLITIPGSMTGMLMVGMQPMDVVQIQVKLLDMLLGATALSCALSSYLGSRALFSKSYQLISEDY